MHALEYAFDHNKKYAKSDPKMARLANAITSRKTTK